MGAAFLAANSIPRLGTEIAFVLGMGMIGAWLVLGRHLPLANPVAVGAHVLRTGDGAIYPFCCPTTGTASPPPVPGRRHLG